MKKNKASLVLLVVKHALLLLILYVLQALVFPWFGTAVQPMLLCVAAAGIAHGEGSFPGALFGLFAGVLTDSALGRPVMTFTLLLTVMGLLIGYLSENWLSGNLPGYAASCAMSCLVCIAVQALPVLLRHGPPIALAMTALIQFAVSMVFSLILLPVIRRLTRAYRRDGRTAPRTDRKDPTG